MNMLRKKTACVLVCALIALIGLALGKLFYHPLAARAASGTLDTFKMQTGASVRTDAPYGIRFTTQISKAEYDSVGENAVFGTLILPANILGDRELTLATAAALKAKNIVAEKWNDPLAEEVTDGHGERVEMKAYTGVIVGSLDENFSEKQFGRAMAARGYVTYTDNEGVTRTSYTPNTEIRSIAYVASAALADGEETEFLYDICETISSGHDLAFAETDVSVNVGESKALTVGGAHGLKIRYSSSDEAILSVKDNGEVKGLAVGEATVTARLGRVVAQAKVTVTAPENGVRLSSSSETGKITAETNYLVGNTHTDLPYIALTATAEGEWLEVEWQGKYMPTIHFLTDTIDGNTKVGTGYLFTNDGGTGGNGLRVYANVRGGTSHVFGAEYGVAKLSAEKTYVLRLGYDAEPTLAPTLSLMLFEKKEDGTLTKLTDGNVPSAVNSAVTYPDETALYILLMGNTLGNVDFNYRIVDGPAYYTPDPTEYPPAYDPVNGDIRLVNTGFTAKQSYYAFTNGADEYLEIKWQGVAMPTVRLATGTLTQKQNDDSGKGYTIGNSRDGQTFTVKEGGITSSPIASYDTLDADADYMLRVGIRSHNDAYYLHVHLYTETEGVLTEAYSYVDVATGNVPSGECYTIVYANTAVVGVTTCTFRKIEQRAVEGLLCIQNTVVWAKTYGATDYQIRVDGGAWHDVSSSTYTYSYVVETPTEGVHTVAVRAKSGNGDVYDIYSETHFVWQP